MRFTEQQLIDIWNQYVEFDKINVPGTFNLLSGPEMYFVEHEKEEELEISDEDIAAASFEEAITKYDAEAVKKAVLEPTIKNSCKPIYKSESNTEHYLHISDLHIPFQLDELESIINKYANRDFNLIINGDFLDCHDISTFPKSKAVGLNNEVKIAADYLKDWCAKFKKVFLISGNHEKRMASYIRKRISPEVVQLVEDDILNYIVESIKLPNLLYIPGDTTNWYVQIDNVVCCHPDDYKGSSVSMLGTAIHALGYFETYNKNVDTIICAHTHHAATGIFKNKVIVESGCMCQPQDYAASGRLNYRPQAISYVTFTSRNWHVDFNSIRLILIS